MADFQDISAFIRLGKDSLDLIKGAMGLLPSGPQRSEIERKVAEAEESLRRSDAQLAKDLGYHLCQCAFPPLPMLWRESEKAHVCQNSECGRRLQSGSGRRRQRNRNAMSV